MSKSLLFSALFSILIISQFFGLYGGGFVPARVFTLLFIPFCFYGHIGKVLKYDMFLVGMIILFLASISVIILSDNVNVKVNEILYSLVNLILLIEIICFSYSIKDVYKIIFSSFLVFILLTIPIAMYEIIFDKHMSVSFLEEKQLVGGLGVNKVFASVSYGNYNQYNFLLAISFPIIASGILKRNFLTKGMRYISILTLSLIALIIIINGSRGAFLSILISLVVFYWQYYRITRLSKIALLKFIFLAIVCCLIVGYFVSNSSIFDYIIYRLTTKGFEDNARAQLISAGFELLVNSNFIGIGPGNFLEFMDKLGYDVRALPPHNMFMEILSQLGILFFLSFLYFLYRIYNKMKIVEPHIKFLLISSLLTLPFNFVINSFYINVVYMWIYFGSLYVLGNCNLKNKLDG